MCTHHCYLTHTATPSTLTHTHLLTPHTSLRLSAHTHKHTHIQSCQAPSLLHGFSSKLCELPACSVSHTHTPLPHRHTVYTEAHTPLHTFAQSEHRYTSHTIIPPPTCTFLHTHPHRQAHAHTHTRARAHTSLSPCPDSRPAPLPQEGLLGQVPGKGAVAATQAPGWATLHRVWPVLPGPDVPSARPGRGSFADARPPVWRGPAPARSAGPRRAARPGSGSALPPAAPPPGCEPRSPAEPPAPGSAAAALCPPSPPPALPPRAPALSPPPPSARGPRPAVRPQRGRQEGAHRSPEPPPPLCLRPHARSFTQRCPPAGAGAGAALSAWCRQPHAPKAAHHTHPLACPPRETPRARAPRAHSCAHMRTCTHTAACPGWHPGKKNHYVY